MKSMEKRRTNLSNSGNHSKWIDTIRLKTKKKKTNINVIMYPVNLLLTVE